MTLKISSGTKSDREWEVLRTSQMPVIDAFPLPFGWAHSLEGCLLYPPKDQFIVLYEFYNFVDFSIYFLFLLLFLLLLLCCCCSWSYFAGHFLNSLVRHLIAVSLFILNFRYKYESYECASDCSLGWILYTFLSRTLILSFPSGLELVFFFPLFQILLACTLTSHCTLYNWSRDLSLCWSCENEAFL